MTITGLDAATRDVAEFAMRAADLRPVLRPNGDALVAAIRAAIITGRSPDDIVWPPIVRVITSPTRRARARKDVSPRPLIKTGRLLNSYRVRVTGRSIDVLNTAPHAHLMQYGTQRGGTSVRTTTTRQQTSRRTGRTWTRTRTASTRIGGVTVVAPRHILPQGGALQAAWLVELVSEIERYISEGPARA